MIRLLLIPSGFCQCDPIQSDPDFVNPIHSDSILVLSTADDEQKFRIFIAVVGSPGGILNSEAEAK